ncbi:MAG: DUF6465 family protein [Alistipes sp.]|nr:DUF6465 family protein [Alistipes sp.]
MAIKKVETKAEEAKTEPAKAATTTVAVKAEAAKTEAPKAAAPVKAEPAKKAEKKTTAKKETAPKKAAKKTPAKKASETVTNLYIQYAGKEFTHEEVINKCKEAAAALMGKKRISSVQSIDIYCKPEEHAAYFVANGDVKGSIDL